MVGRDGHDDRNHERQKRIQGNATPAERHGPNDPWHK